MDIQAYAAHKAVEFGLNPVLFKKVIACESQWNAGAIGDHGQSYGLVQIHLSSHSDVSKEEALNPHFAIDWMAHEWSLGHERQWTCYRLLQ